MAKEVKNSKENKKHFWKDFRAELKKVIWPTAKQVANNTTAVITIVLITAVLVFVLDIAFEKLNTHGIDRLRSAVAKDETGNVVDNTVTDENTVQNETTQEEDNNKTQEAVNNTSAQEGAEPVENNDAGDNAPVEDSKTPVE